MDEGPSNMAWRGKGGDSNLLSLRDTWRRGGGLSDAVLERGVSFKHSSGGKEVSHTGFVASQGGRPLGGVGPSGGPESLGDFDTTGVWTPQGGQVVNKKMESLKGAKTKKRGTNQAINM